MEPQSELPMRMGSIVIAKSWLRNYHLFFDPSMWLYKLRLYLLTPFPGQALELGSRKPFRKESNCEMSEELSLPR